MRRPTRHSYLDTDRATCAVATSSRHGDLDADFVFHPLSEHRCQHHDVGKDLFRTRQKPVACPPHVRSNREHWIAHLPRVFGIGYLIRLDAITRCRAESLGSHSS